jgi:hypothetical protein
VAQGGEARRGARFRLPAPPAFFVAFLISLVIGLAQLSGSGCDVLPVTGDSAKYDGLARGVERVLQQPALLGGLAGGTLSRAERDTLGVDRWEFQHAPGYVVPLGVLYAIFPNDLGAGRALSLILYALSGGLLVLIGRRLLGRRLAWLGFAIYCAYLPFLYYGLGIATEGHAAFSVLLLAYAALRFHRRPGERRALVLGLVLANLFLAKTTFRALFFMLLAGECLYLWRGAAMRAGRDRRAITLRLLGGSLVPVALWSAGLLLIGAPWNPLAQTGEDALVAYRGNYVPDEGWENTGLGDAIGPELDQANRSVTRGREVSETGIELRREIYGRALLLTIAHYPLGWAALCAEKFGRFWGHPPLKTYLRTFAGAWPAPRRPHAGLLPLGLLGVVAVTGRRSGYWLPGALALGVALTHTFTHMVARYQMPVLALWMLYAILGAKVVVMTARGCLRSADAGAIARLPWGWVAGAGGALVAGWLLVTPPVPVPAPWCGLLHGVGALLLASVAPACVPFAMGIVRCARPRMRTGRLRWLWVGVVLWALPVAGARIADRDWDEFACTLSRPGDAILQRITLPPGLSADPERLRTARLEIDMLRSMRGTFEIEVLVQGNRVASFVDTLGARYEDFLFDANMHDYQARYRRVADTYQRFVRGWLNPRYGRASPGYDYFRRWVPVGIPLEALRAGEMEVELRLVACAGGGWVRIYGDRNGPGGNLFVGPAMSENPFEFSEYRAEFLGGEREEMDARLTRPRARWSVARSSMRRTRGTGGSWSDDLDPGWRVRRGDLRIYLRAGLQGELVRRVVKGREAPTWVETPQVGDVPLGIQEIRRLQWWRDSYFDGTRIL